MLDKFGKILLLITTVGTFLGLYLKCASSLLVESIKIKYKAVPEENSIFQVILKMSVYIFWITYVGFIVMFIYSMRFQKAISFSMNLSRKSLIDYLGMIVAILFLIISTITPCFFIELNSIFSRRLKGESDIYISIKKKYINSFNIICSAALAILSFIGIYYCIKNSIRVEVINSTIQFRSNFNISSFNELVSIAYLGVLSSSVFIVGLSMNETFCILVNNSTYTLYSDRGEITCKCYLEYKEYYLIIEDTSERYIKKSSVKEIKRILEKVSSKEKIVKNKKYKYKNSKIDNLIKAITSKKRIK